MRNNQNNKQIESEAKEGTASFLFLPSLPSIEVLARAREAKLHSETEARRWRPWREDGT